MTFTIPPHMLEPVVVKRVAPFSYQDGETYLSELERVKTYLIELSASINESYQDEVNNLIAQVNTALADQGENVEVVLNAAIADINARADEWLSSQLESSDYITASNVSDNSTATAAAIDDRAANVAAASIAGIDYDTNTAPHFTDSSSDIFAGVGSAVASHISIPESTVQNAIDDRISGTAAAIIASDPTIESAAVSAVQNAAVADAVRWNRPPITNADCNTLVTPGSYPTGNSSSTQSISNRPPGATSSANLTVIDPLSNQAESIQVWKEAGRPYSRVWERALTAGIWGSWIETTPGLPKPILTGTNIDTLNNDSVLGLWRWPGVAGLSGSLPFGDYPFTLSVINTNGAVWHIAYPGGSSDYGVIKVRKYSPLGTVGWSKWSNLNEDYRDSSLRNEREIRVSRLRQSVGVRRTNGRPQICIVMDHGTNNMLSIVEPILSARNIDITYAINSEMYNSSEPINAHENLSTWSDVARWHNANGWEIASHTKTHRNTDDVDTLRDEIIGGRVALELNVPGLLVDTFVQTGNSGSKWAGFNDGDSWEKYYQHFAGDIVLNSHAVVMGLTPNTDPLNSYAMTGHNLIGCNGRWIDSGSGATARMADIQQLIDGNTDRGYIVRLHPQVINTAGYITTAELTAFMDFISAKRDVGDIDVITMREWAVTVSG